MEPIPKLYSDNTKRLERIPTHGNTTVLVTSQFQSERLIHAGRRIANISSTNLYVLHIQNNEQPANPEAIQHLFNVSSQNGATMQLLYSDNAFKTICKYIRDSKAGFVITGTPSTPDSILHKIWKRFRHVHFFTVNENGIIEEVTHPDTHGLPKEAEEA